MTTENGLFCLHCQKPLVDKQAKFCSNAHRQAFGRAKKKRESERTSDSSERTIPPNQNAIEVFEQVKRDLARSEGMIVTLTDERDKLRSERNTLSNRLIDSEKANGVLQGKLEVVEAAQQAAAPVSAEPTPQGNNYALWAVGVLMLIVVIVLIVVAMQVFGG